MKRSYLTSSTRWPTVLIALATGCWLTACQPATEKASESESTTSTPEKQSVPKAQSNASDQSKVFIVDLINQFPSSLEVAVMLQATGKELAYNYLEGPIELNENLPKAINLGASITRFFFCNLDNNTAGIKAENDNIRNLANDLEIGLAYKAKEIMEAPEPDLQLQRAAFSHEMMIYLLQEQNRELTSIGVIFGDWLESFYFLAQHYQKTNNPVLKEKIGEQKILIPNLIQLFEQYRGETPMAGQLLDLLIQLEKEYESITFEKEYQSPKMEVNENGQLVFTDNSKTIVTFSRDNIGDIVSLINEMRTKYVVQPKG